MIISNNSSLPLNFLIGRTSYICSNVPWETVSPKKIILSRRLTMHCNDSSSIALHLKTHSIPKSKFRKILVVNTTIITPEINKLRLQILGALHIKTKKPKINRVDFENSDNVLKCLYSKKNFFIIPYFLIMYYFPW